QESVALFKKGIDVINTYMWMTHATLFCLQVASISLIAAATEGCPYWRGYSMSWERSPYPIKTMEMPGTFSRILGRFLSPRTSSHMIPTKISLAGFNGQTSARL